MSATVTLEEKRLILSGALLREDVATVFRELTRISANEITLIDVTRVTEIDSAGVALLSKWIDTHFKSPHRPMLLGDPEGLADLRAAYRLTEQLEFARSN